MAYCTADSYQFRQLLEKLKKHFPSTFYRDAIHIATSRGDACFFSYGTAVFWGLTEEEELNLLGKIKPVEIDPITPFEWDRYEFSYGEKIRIQRDELVLPNSDPMTKLALSYGLAQSVKLSVFEETIDQTITKTRHLPEDLARKGKIFLSRKAISKKIGELFIDRSSINLHSDILDEPDFFWEYPEHHPLYRDLAKCLDLTPRVEVLNTRLGIIGDLLEILSDQLNHQHSSILEWTIIWLIVIEVVLVLISDVFHLI